MAAAQSPSPLRRWKPFFSTFGAIDAAIEASAPAGSLPRDAFRSVRGEIVRLLCGADDDGVAEELCLALDDAMAESLLTLRVAPVATSALASTDLAKAVAALGEHESERIRSLARDVVRGWRAALQGDLARARAAMEALDKLFDVGSVVGHARSCRVPFAADEDDRKRQVKDTSPSQISRNRAAPPKVSAPLHKKSAPVVAGSHANPAKMNPTTKAPQMQIKKMPSVVGNSGGDRIESDKMEATKRKLREGYQQVEDAKRQRKIQVIEAPKMLEQRQQKMHPILGERSRARCGSSTTVRRTLMPSLRRVWC